MNTNDFEYAGFWIRTWAALIDSALIAIITYPILTWVYGSTYWSSDKMIQGPADLLFTWIFPTIAVILFWATKQATPGKMAIAAKIVDAQTGNNATTGQLIARYAAYFIAVIPLCLGIFWVGLDSRKQGWHDKLSGTVVIRKKAGVTKPVRFNAAD
jgi:uncharacterized RDD family membrane protein YckC